MTKCQDCVLLNLREQTAVQISLLDDRLVAVFSWRLGSPNRQCPEIAMRFPSTSFKVFIFDPRLHDKIFVALYSSLRLPELAANSAPFLDGQPTILYKISCNYII